MEKYKNILPRDTASSDVKKNLAEAQQKWHAAKLQIQVRFILKTYLIDYISIISKSD